MKIIEAMKAVKDLLRKADDLRTKIKNHAADMDFHTPAYDDQRGKVRGWLQAHEDIIKEVERLRYCLQKTNLVTRVKIELGGKQVEKSISEWIFRRTQLAALDRSAWAALAKQEQEKRLQDGWVDSPTGDGTQQAVKVRRHYDPEERDKKVELYTSESSLIDGRLEVINAITDLIEHPIQVTT